MIEVLVVLVLMSVIATIAIPRFGQVVADKQLDHGRRRLMALVSEAGAVARQVRKKVTVNIVITGDKILLQREVQAGGFDALIAEPSVNFGMHSNANLNQINVFLLGTDGTRTAEDPLDLTAYVLYFNAAGAFICEDSEGAPQAADGVEFELLHDLGTAQITVSRQGLVLDGLRHTPVQTITDADGFEQPHPPL